MQGNGGRTACVAGALIANFYSYSHLFWSFL